MNKYVTYCAKAKILNLLEKANATGAVFSMIGGGLTFKVLFNPPTENTIMINSSPKLYTDIDTLSTLEVSSIDFDYRSNEFVFERRKNVIHTNFR